MFSPSTPSAEERDYVKWADVLNKLMLVRPLEYRSDFKTQFSPEGTDVVFADIAVVDEIDPATGQQGRIYRAQAVLQGFLKGAWKRQVGNTVIGMVYQGPPTKGRPPFMWHDLYSDPGAVARGQAWLQNNQSFLVQLQPSTPEPQIPAYTPPAAQTPAYTAPAAAPAASGGMTTLDQLKQMSLGGGVNHHGDPQADAAPF